MDSLTKKLSTICGHAFEAGGFSPELGLVRVSDRPDLAQFQCNGALAAAKAAKKNPREVAQGVVKALSLSLSPLRERERERGGQGEGNAVFSKIEIAGPGFINFNVTDDFLAAHLADVAADAHLGVPQSGENRTVVLDYGGPNIAKAMHVGHLRSSIIGDSLRRIMAFAGYRALGDVHMGDWGTPMGMIIAAIRRGDAGPDPEITMDMLEKIYPQASAACKEDPVRMEEARAATVALQNKESDAYGLWRRFIDVSVAGMKKNFDALNVHFDLWKGESDAHDLIAPMVGDLKKRGFAREDDGALVVAVKRDDDDKEIPPLILHKRDGAVMYGTTDLATIVGRLREFHPAKIIYVVDQRQSLHFEQVFRAARLTGIAAPAVELTHAGFGTMNGPDGKPFKTRAGGVMKLEDLIAMGIEKAHARLKEAELAKDFDEAERADIAHKVAIAAIKFADLQNQRQSDYVFDLDRLTSFEGKTGPYILYQAVRVKSLLRKAGDPIIGSSGHLVIRNEDRPLALLLTEFPEVFDAALRNYMPHHLCDYVYRLAQGFSQFYASCHILSEPDEKLRQSRLALCALTLKEIECVLDLLGIAIPGRM